MVHISLLIMTASISKQIKEIYDVDLDHKNITYCPHTMSPIIQFFDNPKGDTDWWTFEYHDIVSRKCL